MEPVEGILDPDLIQQLGPSDESNPLLSVRKKSKGFRKKRTERRSEKVEGKVERKKEEKRKLEEVYEELRRSALSTAEWNQLQKHCVKRKKNRQWELNPASSDDDAPMSPAPISAAPLPKPPIHQEEFHTETELTLPLTVEQQSPKTEKLLEKESAVLPHRVVHVRRTEEIEACRTELPIIGYEQEILELISQHDVVVLCGPTGCGKTTQVPQFLYEAGYGCPQFPERSGLIGVTQPRRLAAVSISSRVAAELNSTVGGGVGYQIRHDSRLSSGMRIKFVTDGVLIRELQQDFVLAKYSVLVIDEAHERSLNTDLLIGMLSRVVSLRRKLQSSALKLVIMSATLEASAFLSNKNLFKVQPPLLSIPSRQFPVTIHFSKKTEVQDYETSALKKVVKIHRQLPPGGILVFLTGKRQIEDFCAKLQSRLDRPSTPSVSEDESEEEVEVDSSEEEVCRDARILPLYALLPPHRQALVFQPVEKQTRLIVVSTNVAETSLTIPGIRYVVDTGRAKKKVLNRRSGVANFEVDWISKASAVQRTGRAGRTQPGHCYRLYSSAHFGEAFPEFDPPEISQVSLEGVVLLLKSMGITSAHSFPFPLSPEPEAIVAAESTLVALGAVDSASNKVTTLGKQMVEYPVSPRHSRLILEALRFETTRQSAGFEGLTLYAISLAAAMSFESPFLEVHDRSDRDSVKKAQRKFHHKSSDFISALLVLLSYRHHTKPSEFCRSAHLNSRTMKEMVSLERQLLQIFFQTIPQSGSLDQELIFETPLLYPSERVLDQLRRCILAGWCDHVGRKEVEVGSLLKKGGMYIPAMSVDRYCIHPTSILAKRAPEYIVYAQALRANEKVYLQGITRVEPDWFHEASSALCKVLHPAVLSPGAYYDERTDTVRCWHKVLYGKHSWELPLQSLPCQDPNQTAACFAGALLEGKIVGKSWFSTEKLTMSPQYVKTIDARCNKRLGLLLMKLMDHKISSKRDLFQSLLKDAMFLRVELRLWIKKPFWNEFDSLWKEWPTEHLKKS